MNKKYQADMKIIFELYIFFASKNTECWEKLLVIL